jgi:hypothetical protein
MRDSSETGSGTRRQFLKAGLRACALGGLALTGTVLGLRTAAHEARSPGCTVDLPCRRCGRLQACSESRASQVREEAGGAGGREGSEERRDRRD